MKPYWTKIKESELVSLPLFLFIWEMVAILLNNRLLPGPVDVFLKVWELSIAGDLLYDLGKSLHRAGVAFLVSMILGTIIGTLLGHYKLIDRLFNSWVLIGLNIPAIVVAILFYIWLGLTEIALIAAVVVNKTPLVAVIMREGYRSLNVELEELSRVYRIPFTVKIFRFVLPQLMPFLLNSARTGLSLIWKIVLVFEVLGSDGGVGFQIGIFFQYFDIESILAYAVTFMSVVLFIEYFLLRSLENRVLGWHLAQKSQ